MVGDTGFVRESGALVWLTGDDRLAFLERMSTNRLTDLPPGAGRATAILTDTGRVVDLVAVHATVDGVALVTSASAAATVVAAHLQRYVMYRDQVRVTDATAQVAVLRVLGPRSVALVGTLLDVAAVVAVSAPGQWWRLTVPEADELWLLRHPAPGGMGGADLVVPRGEAVQWLAGQLAAAGAAELDVDAYTALRIAAGWPAFGHEIDQQANPLELGLRAVVDFAKGCYIGQEVVARLDSYDKVQRRLVRLAADGPIGHGDSVEPAHASGSVGRRDRAGQVTSAAPEPGGAGWRALALVPAGWPVAAELIVRPAPTDSPTAGAVTAHITDFAEGGYNSV